MNTKLSFAIHEVVSMMDIVADDILQSRLGVGFATARFLMVIGNFQPCSQRFLADCLWVSAPAISKTLPDYVANGWIQIEVDPKQPRRNLLRLTPKGQELADSSKSLLEHEFQNLLGKCGVDADSFGQEIQSIHSALFAMTQARKEKHS